MLDVLPAPPALSAPQVGDKRSQPVEEWQCQMAAAVAERVAADGLLSLASRSSDGASQSTHDGRHRQTDGLSGAPAGPGAASMGEPQNSSDTHSEGRSGDAQPTSTSGRHDAASPSCKRRRTGAAASEGLAASGAAPAPPITAVPADGGQGRYNLSAAAAHLRPQIFHMGSAASDTAALLRTPSGRGTVSPTTGLPRLHSSQLQNASLAPSTDAWQPAPDEGGAADAPPRLSSNEVAALAKAQQALQAELAPDDLLHKLRSTIKQIEQSLASERSSGLSAMTGVSRQRSALEQVTAVLNASRSHGLDAAAASAAAASMRSTRLEEATSAAAGFDGRPPLGPSARPAAQVVADWSLLNDATRPQRPSFPQRAPSQSMAPPAAVPRRTTSLPSIARAASAMPLQRHALPAQETVTYLSRLMPITVQIAVFADEGTFGRWCQHIDSTHTAKGRALYRMAARLICAGLQTGHLQPLLQLQLQRRHEDLARAADAAALLRQGSAAAAAAMQQ